MNTPQTDKAWSFAQGETVIDWDARKRRTCARIEEDFNEARLELLAYFAREHLTCGWCGEMMPAPKGFTPPMTAEKVEQIARLHMIDCPDHPIRETERVLAEERQWLADTREALKKVKAERDAAIREKKMSLP